MADYEIRQSDFGRDISVRARDIPSGLDTPIPPGTTVQFRMVHQETGHVVTGAAVVSSPEGLTTNNVWTYTFADGDTANEGSYEATFTATYPGPSGRETFPTCSKGAEKLIIDICPR